jgi:hypothetical protein
MFLYLYKTLLKIWVFFWFEPMELKNSKNYFFIFFTFSENVFRVAKNIFTKCEYSSGFNRWNQKIKNCFFIFLTFPENVFRFVKNIFQHMRILRVSTDGIKKSKKYFFIFCIFSENVFRVVKNIFQNKRILRVSTDGMKMCCRSYLWRMQQMYTAGLGPTSLP